VGRNLLGLEYIGHGGSIGGFTAEAGWYPAAQAAVVVLMNSNGNIDPGAIGVELAAELLPTTQPTVAQFTGDASPLVGKYQGPSRGRDMIVEVTTGAQGPMFSVNGGPARSLPWVEGLTFRQGSSYMTFRRPNPTAPANELRVQGSSAYLVLTRR